MKLRIIEQQGTPVYEGEELVDIEYETTDDITEDVGEHLVNEGWYDTIPEGIVDILINTASVRHTSATFYHKGVWYEGTYTDHTDGTETRTTAHMIDVPGDVQEQVYNLFTEKMK